MTNKELAVEMLNLIDTTNVQNKVIVNAVMRLLDEPEKKTKEPEQKETKPADKPTKPGRKPSIDWGKAKACRAAGWSIDKIADELRCSPVTIRQKFKQEGVQ